MGKLPMTTFICNQRRRVAPVHYAPTELAGKTVLVIGGNAGIGFETCKHFAQMGPARLIIGCRSRQRGQAALEDIEKQTGYKAGLMLVDLGDFASVGAFADKYEKEVGRLDLLVENAAVANNTLTRTVDGWESNIQINDLATSLLALLLIPTLLKTAKEHKTSPRVVIVGSETHHWVALKASLLNQPNPLKTLSESKEYCTKSALEERYMVSKLVSILLVRALAERLQNSPIIVNTVTPGFCYSNLRSTMKGFAYYQALILEPFIARTTEEGSRQIIFASIHGIDNKEEEWKMKGAYIQNGGVAEVSDWVISAEGHWAQDKLWDNMIDELALVNGRVKKVVSEHLST